MNAKSVGVCGLETSPLSKKAVPELGSWGAGGVDDVSSPCNLHFGPKSFPEIPIRPCHLPLLLGARIYRWLLALPGLTTNGAIRCY